MIWGESYAGVYVPTLADLVYAAGDSLKLNFLGFGVGDPCTDDKTQTFTEHLNFNLDFAYDKGFVATENYKFISDNCVSSDVRGIIVPNTTTPECKKAWRLYYLTTSGGDGNGPASVIPNGGFIDPYNSWGPNNEPFWKMLAGYLAEDYFMTPIYNKLAGKLRNIIVFNGDTDPSVQMRGTEAAVSSFGLKATEEWRPWFYKPEETSPAVLVEKLPYFGTFLSYKSLLPQLGGYVKDYENNVSFVTVHDSGHMVPQYKPLAAFHLFVRGLLNKPLAPPLNQTCLEGDGCSDDEFFGYNDTT